MKKTFLLFTALYFSLSFAGGWGEAAFAQTNLVPNPSFEDTIHCPTLPGEISYALDWISPTLGSPDYNNSCSTGIYCGVPINYTGYQYAHTGNAYAGFCIYTPDTGNYREYIQIQLTDTLMKNEKYSVSCFGSIADSSQYLSNNLEFLFTKQMIAFPSIQHEIYLNPQGKNKRTVFDKTNWKLVQDTFIAKGGERYLTIGNFLSDSSSTGIYVGGANVGYWSYLYVDDISVTDLKENVLAETIPFLNISIYPNPVHDNLIVEVNNQEINELKIYNSFGILIKTVYIKQSRTEINLNNLSSGLYYLIFKNNNSKQFSKTIIKN